MLTIREAREADWPEIWALFQTVAAGGDAFAYDESTSEEDGRKLWFEPPSTCRVAEEGDVLLGTYFIRPNQPGRGAHVANGGYMVCPTARGHGIASALCEHSLTTARGLGFAAMQFNLVVASNAAALKVWEKNGFSVAGILPGAFRHKQLGLVDAFVMFRKL